MRGVEWSGERAGAGEGACLHLAVPVGRLIAANAEQALAPNHTMDTAADLQIFVPIVTSSAESAVLTRSRAHLAVAHDCQPRKKRYHATQRYAMFVKCVGSHLQMLQAGDVWDARGVVASWCDGRAASATEARARRTRRRRRVNAARLPRFIRGDS